MTRIIGIDIGTYSIKVARVDMQSRGYQLAGFREFVLRQDPNVDRTLQIIEILRGIASEFDPEECRYVLALPQTAVSVRSKVFPFRERLKILKSVPFELEDDIPLDQDDAVFEAKILKYGREGTDVLACATPKENVRSILALLSECNIDPEIITVEGFAFANTVEDWMAQPPIEPETTASLAVEQTQLSDSKAAVLHLHLGHSTTLVVLYRQGVLQTVRPILWGGKQVADLLARKYQIPFVEAIKILQTKGFILINEQGRTRDEIYFSQTICEAVNQLVAELRLILIDLKTEFGIEYDQILISGGVSQIPHLGPYLTQHLEVPVNVHNHLQRHSTSYFEKEGSNAFISNIAIGLAFEGMKRPRNPASNLRRDEFGKQSKTLKVLWEKWKPAAFATAALFVSFLIYSVMRESAATSLTEAADENLKAQAKATAQLSGARASESNVRKLVSERQREIKARETLKELKGMTSALDILKRLAELAPLKTQVQVDIRNLSVKKETLTIEGEVASAAQVEVLKKAWAALARDGQVQTVPASIKVQAPRAAFSFRMKISRWLKGAP